MVNLAGVSILFKMTLYRHPQEFRKFVFMIIFLCFVLLIIPSVILGQGILDVSWFKTQDGPMSQQDYAWGVDLDSAGNIYWVTSQKVSGFNEKDIFTYLLDPSGNNLWPTPHVFGKLFEQQAYNAVYHHGVLYVGGRTWTGYFNLRYSDALLYALDTQTRDTLWKWSWDGGYGYEEVDGIAIGNDGIYISGWTEDSLTAYDQFIAKLNFNGQTAWLHTWGTENFDSADGHCIIDDSTIYVSGMYNSINALVGGKAVLVAYERADGDYKWHRLWGGSGQEDGLGLGSDGTYLYQCGITSSFGDSTVFINKYDKSGNLIRSLHTNLASRSRSLDFSPSGDLYLSGTTINRGAGNEDVVIIHYDSAGNMLAYKTWGGSANESAHDIRVRNGYLYVVGRTVSFSANNYDDAFLIKAPLFGNSITTNKEIDNILIYPNPAVDYFIISGIREFNCHDITITDLTGRVIHTFSDTHDRPVRINASAWSRGVYFIRIGGTDIRKIIIGKF